jgi:glycosyltransferase involved in cell wall biosynthesis
MTDKNFLVSIIIPCYNAEPWIAEAIDSCLAQTYQPIEIIVVDDGSTDGSLKVIQSYGNRIQYRTGPNRGGSAARNQGFALSRGEYVMFLDADDLIAPDTIEVLVKVLRTRKNSVAACNWYHLIETNGKWIKGENGLQPWHAVTDPLAAWLTRIYIPPVALLWHRNTLQEIGGWDEVIRANQDGDLMMRALINGISIIPVDGGAAYYRIHESHRSTSKNQSKAAFQSRLQVLQKAESALSSQGRLSDYAISLAQAYHGLAVGAFAVDTDLARKCVQHSKELAGYRAITGSIPHRILCYLIGVENKEKLAQNLARIGIASKIRKHALRQI